MLFGFEPSSHTGAAAWRCVVCSTFSASRFTTGSCGILVIVAPAAWPERGLDIRGTYKNGAAITLHLPPIILRTRNAFDVGPIFVECQQPAFLTPLELRVEDFEGKFTDTATNTPVAVVHEKVNVLVRVVVVSGIKGGS
jgi:hypothetical protein